MHLTKKETVEKFVQLTDKVQSLPIPGETLEEKKAALLDIFKASNEKYDQFKKNNLRSED